MCDYDGSHLEAHKREINALWPQVDVHTRQFDAADEKAVKEVVDDAVKRYGRLDVFFANAGITGPHTLFTQMEADDFMETLRVNTLRSAHPHLHLPPSLPRSLPT
jgi:NAD(P)-dependent dehydrogenase (short-subunit alcohol dehydrogenase family)